MTHRIAIVEITGVSPYSPSRYHQAPIADEGKENRDTYARRTWREFCHYNKKTGDIVIPCMAFKNCLAESAQFLGRRIPGKGQATYTKHFDAGVLATDNVPIGYNINEINEDEHMDALFLNADGKRGSGTRVMKYYPRFDRWSGTVHFHVFDDVITEKEFEYTLRQAGQFIGIGRFRPRNRGYYGRFDVNSITWTRP